MRRYYGLGTRLTPSSGGLTDATGLHDPNAFGSASSVSFTSGAVVSGSYVYLYGGVSILAGAQVARVPISTFENTTTWAYYDGSSYQSNPSNAKGVMALGAAGNTVRLTIPIVAVRPVGLKLFQVFYSSALGGYYNVYSGYGSSAVYMQSASAPEGPWSCASLQADPTRVRTQTDLLPSVSDALQLDASQRGCELRSFRSSRFVLMHKQRVNELTSA